MLQEKKLLLKINPVYLVVDWVVMGVAKASPIFFALFYDKCLKLLLFFYFFVYL